jgi:thiamine kinase-like enzyme
VIKRLKPEIARRNELVARRWLPAIGLPEAGPPLLGSVAARSGACVWHVYDDLGAGELNPQTAGSDEVQAAIELIAELHTRFAGHVLMGEVRLLGGDLGMHFYETNVRDAILALRALPAPRTRQAECDRLLERLSKLQEEADERATALAQLDGLETLLHGDLWAINVFVLRGEQGARARLIDWDHAAVGPPTYDLSTFLLRFPRQTRHAVLQLYRRAVAQAGWELPSPRELNFLFETHEYARFANRIIWPAIALAVDRTPWGFDALVEVDQWFEQFEPVLPDEGTLAP